MNGAAERLTILAMGFEWVELSGHGGYRGRSKTRLGNYMLGAAINAKRWIRLLAWQHEHDTMKKAA